ncbi:MAG: Gfo/Idh/MocA family oxidoreductase [Armatimonadota bacterium]|nr:Gfo/Idh/MocA family oxidoreductase [Armatimonadota bacterium]MDW8142850.1 Gfo/Idh/MocA family oxidoreductase [Armatimonadota bacterium]
MVRVGIVDTDTSHAVEFTKRLNHIGIAEEQWVEGAKVVAAWTSPSAITPEERHREYNRILQEDLGIKFVNSLDELRSLVDAVMVLSQDGSVHLERAKPFLEAGMPVFVDKPFACSLHDALLMAEIAERHNAPLFSSSSLRYALEVQKVHEQKSEWGKVIGADAFSPAPTHQRNPGLFHYGIHGVETLFALMGKGCRRVRCVYQDDGEVVVGEWEDGRIGTMRGIRKGAHAYGFSVVCEKQAWATTIDIRYIYRELLKRVVEMFQTRKQPIEISETLQIIAFIEGAKQSAEQHGVPVDLPVF